MSKEGGLLRKDKGLKEQKNVIPDSLLCDTKSKSQANSAGGPMSTIRSGDRQGQRGREREEEVKEKDGRMKSFTSGVQVFVFSPIAGTSHESHWEKQFDNKPYSSLLGITIDSLDLGTDSSSGGPAGGTDGMQACL